MRACGGLVKSSAGGEVRERGEWARCGCVCAAVRAHCPLPSRIGLNHSGTFLMPHVQQGRPSLRQGVKAGVGEAAWGARSMGVADLMKNLSSLIMPTSNCGSLAAQQNSSCDGAAARMRIGA